MYKGREIADYLDDIRTAIAEVEEFTCGMTFEAFAADKKTINAVIRSLEVLGPRAVEPHRHRKSPTVHRQIPLAANLHLSNTTPSKGNSLTCDV